MSTASLDYCVYPLIATKEQQENLQKLLDGLKEVAKKESVNFDMAYFCKRKDNKIPSDFIDARDSMNVCGTVRCMVEYGPVLGIPILPEDQSWSSYAERAFGSAYHSPAFDSDDTDDNFLWLFHGFWSTDNTKKSIPRALQLQQGITRLSWTLKHKAYIVVTADVPADVMISRFRQAYQYIEKNFDETPVFAVMGEKTNA